MFDSFVEDEQQQNNFDDPLMPNMFNGKDTSFLINSINDFDNLALPNPSPNPNPELTVENKINIFTVIEEKSTAVSNKIVEIPIKQNDEYVDIPNPKYNSFDVIKQVFSENNIQQKFIDIIDKYKEDPQLKEAEKDIITSHKKRKVYNYQNKKANFGKFKSGRKKKGDLTERKHGKIAPDNIIKKLKSKFIDSLMKFINNFIQYINLMKGEREGEGKIQLLKKVNYKKYIDNMDRKQNLIILQKPIKDILSYEISTKFTKFPSDWNKKIIDSILKYNIEDTTIIFNMKFNEWIDYFLLKNKENSYQKIEKCLPKINTLLEDILAKNDEYYLSKFIFYLYNYERWFYNKVGRNRKKNKKNNY